MQKSVLETSGKIISTQLLTVPNICTMILAVKRNKCYGGFNMRYYPNYFDDFFNDTKKQDTNTVLRTDIYEKDGYYQICMEVCGIQKENIQIELKDGYLKITATRNINKENTRVIRQERFTGSYSRSFYIGEGYKQEDIKARFENGELFILLPTKPVKREEETRYINIQ